MAAVLTAGAVCGLMAAPASAQGQASTQSILYEPAPGPVIRHGGDKDAVVTTTPRIACLTAIRRAERTHGLPEGFLVAVALSESGLHAHALNIGGRAYYPDDPGEARALLRRSGGRSVMAGCVQVNAGVHARGADWPLDPVRSANWAAGNLQRWHQQTGSWTEALRRWHGGSPAGTRRLICRVRAKLEVTAPGSDILSGTGCAGGEMARVRRSGATLLEVAEAAPR